MRKIVQITLFFIAACASGALHAQDTNLLPKYGSVQRSSAQQAVDRDFVNEMDKEYKGDLKRASDEVATRGWEYLRQNNGVAAMLSFNQAWLLDRSNGRALWGMAAVQAGSGKIVESLPLFAEAEPLMTNEVSFSIDYARTLGIAGAQAKNDAQMKDALKRFALVGEKNPQNVLNLQNWAITLFYAGNYAEAWSKIKLAEATPRADTLDRNFIRALQEKMPRP